jgi:hypothetical protein
MSHTQATTPTIRCKAELCKIGSQTVFRLPDSASRQLPSRGQVMVTGTFNDADFTTALEPDGMLSHYFKVEPKLLKAAGAKAGDTVALTISVTKDWPEPNVPAEWQKALAASPKAHALWQQTTPMARWEWIRWARSSSNADTRQRRIKVGISKLESGKRRPCCWNRNLSTEPDVSKGGVLLVPS